MTVVQAGIDRADRPSRTRAATAGVLSVYFLVFVNPFTVPLVGDIELGPLSLRYLRDVLLISLCALYIVERSSARSLIVPRVARPAIGLLFAFVVYYVASLLWSAAPGVGLRYFPKYIVPVIATIAVLQAQGLEAERLYRALIYGMIAYLAGSLPLHVVLDTPYLEGFSTRHFSKFIAIFGVIIAFAEVITRGMSRTSAVLGVLSALVLALVLQRGAVIACVVGMMAVLFAGGLGGKRELRRAVIIVTIAFLALVALVTSEWFLSYAFYSGVPADVILDRLLSGALDESLIRDRGRFTWISYMLSHVNLSLEGVGMGTIPALLGGLHGSSNYELHNDMLLILYESGLFGMGLFSSAMLACLVWAIRGSRTAVSVVGRLAYRSGLGTLVASLTWMFISNVWNYSTVSIAPALLCLVIGMIAERSATRSYGATSEETRSPRPS